MKKRTKASKQRLNNLFILLVLTAVLLVMSTYAWFTANRTVKIDSIDVHVSTSSGLQISADGIDWKTVLTKDDLVAAHTTYADAVNQLPDNMAPVSTALNQTDRYLDMFYGSVSADLETGSSTYGEYLLTSVKQTDVESSTITTSGEYDKGYYIAFDIFLKSGNDATDLYMSGSTIEMVEDTTTGDLVAASSTQEKGIANAARVALIKGENTDSETTSTIQALSTANGTVMMWEPNADAHTSHGVENAESLGWVTTGQLTEGTGNSVISYDGLKDAFTTGVLLKNAVTSNSNGCFADVTPTWTSNKGDTPSLQMPDESKSGGNALTAGVTKYRIYMWVEGQDVDCENYASGTYLEYKLSFSLDPIDASSSTTTGS